MDLREFEDLVDRFGDDIGRWPPERRAAAQAHAASSVKARALLRQAADLRRRFADEPRISAPADLAARILARAAAEPPQAPPPGGRLRRWTDRLEAVRDSLARPVGGSSVRLAAALAGCFVIGFALGTGRLAGDSVETTATARAAAADVYLPILR